MGIIRRFLQERSSLSVARKQPYKLSSMNSRLVEQVASQEMNAGDSITNSQQHIYLNLAESEFFFDLEIRTLDNKSLQADASLSVDDIYLISISISLNRYRGDLDLFQYGIIIERKLLLILKTSDFECLDDINLSLEIKCRRSWHHSIRVRPRKRHSAQIYLLYQEEGSDNPLRLATKLCKNIEVNQDEQPDLKKFTLVRSENDITLYIEENEKKLLVQGIYSGVSPFYETLNPPSDRFGLKKFSRDNAGDLIKWLRCALKILPENSCLAIQDNTELQVCWEEIHWISTRNINGNEVKDWEYLGSKIAVVRWPNLTVYGDQIFLSLNRNTEYYGQPAAFVSAEDSKHYPNAFTCQDDWHTYAIKQAEAEITRVLWLYSKGHLYCEDELDNWDWEPLEHAQRNPYSINFDKIQERVLDRRFFLFANAPYSARIVWIDSQQGGVVLTALKQVASGCIGLLGEVPPNYALQVQEMFQTHARQEAGVQPAEFLRKIRECIVKEKQVDASAETYAFRYVYYGSPRDVVKIKGGIVS